MQQCKSWPILIGRGLDLNECWENSNEFITNPYKEITATILTSVYNCLLLYFLNAMQLSVFVGKDRAEKWHAKYRKVFCLAHKITYIAEMRYNTIPVIMAMRIHLFPFRTQKLSSSTAKVLDHPRSGRIASCRISKIKHPHSWVLYFFTATCYPNGRTSKVFSKTVGVHCFCLARWACRNRSRQAVTEAAAYPYCRREGKLPDFKK